MPQFRFLYRYRRLVATFTLAGVLIAGLAILWRQPRWAINHFAPLICPGAVFYIPLDEPVIALTIDDGPDDQRTGDENTTARLLDVLATHQAKATFFLISNRISNQNQTLIAKMVQQGHELGNHLVADVPSVTLSLSEFNVAIDQAEQALLAAAKHDTSIRWMRPGSGRCNSEMAQIAQGKGYKIALGEIWPYDTTIPSSTFAVQQILANVRPGSIIVLHDYGPNGEWGDRTVDTLSQVLPELNRRGYRVVTLTTLSQLATSSKGE